MGWVYIYIYIYIFIRKDMKVCAFSQTFGNKLLYHGIYSATFDCRPSFPNTTPQELGHDSHDVS